MLIDAHTHILSLAEDAEFTAEYGREGSLCIYRSLGMLPSHRARPGGHPDASGLWGILVVRSLREAVMNAQPLLGMSAGTRGRSSQPPVPHEYLVQSRGAVPAPSATDR